MTRKDYQLIASIIRESFADFTDDTDTAPLRFKLIGSFASELRQTNPRFDVARFIQACEGEQA